MTQTDCPFEYRIESVHQWANAKKILESLPAKWVFRGQPNSAHLLKTSLDRASKNHHPLVAEFYMFQSFRRRAHHYLPMNLLPRRRIDWLALMQHHGAPTRLLDWTRSPYIAAYFAVERGDTDWSIWAIDSEWCKERGCTSILGKITDDSPSEQAKSAALNLPHQTINENDYIESIFRWKADGVFPVEPFWMNQRITLQQGLFLIPGNVGKTFGENLSSYSDHDIQNHVLKIDVAASARIEALSDLEKMNITRASLFPGIDGFAQSLWQKLEVASDLDEFDDVAKRTMWLYGETGID